MEILARKLNKVLLQENLQIYNLLSAKGRALYFPTLGILGQTAQAQGTALNATVGIALEENKDLMRLSSIAKNIPLPPEDVFSYTSSYGLPSVRQRWKEEILKKNPSLKMGTTLPIPTAGITHALSLAGYLFVNPQDTIILPEPFWENYNFIFEEGYASKMETFPFFLRDKFNLPALEKKLQARKGKVILLLNFPHNPTGYTLTNSEVEELRQVIERYAEGGNSLVIILDDAYFGLVYQEGVFQESLLSIFADIHPNIVVVKIDGASKEEFSWGLRVGFITLASKGITTTSCKALEDKIAGAVRATVSNVSHLSQSLIASALAAPEHEQEKREKQIILRRRFQKVEEVLRDQKYVDYFSALPCNSGYFICLQLQPGLQAEKVRKTLLQKYKTGVIAINNLLRVAFSSVTQREIKPLFENIYNACKEQN